MALRADDGTLLEAKEPVLVLGPENSESSGAKSSSEATQPFESAQNPYGFHSTRAKTIDLGKWGFWLAPLAILAVALFLVFGTLFVFVFVGLGILVAVGKKLLNVFFGI